MLIMMPSDGRNQQIKSLCCKPLVEVKKVFRKKEKLQCVNREALTESHDMTQ